MENKKFAFEDFAPDYLNVLKYFLDDEFDKLYREKEDRKEIINEYLSLGDEDYGVIEIFPFFEALQSNKKDLIKLLKKYADYVNRRYQYYEHEYGGFNEYYEGCLGNPNPAVLYLCIKYFDSIGEREKANLLALIILCCGYTWMFPHLEERFEELKSMFEADWLTLHPQATCWIGEYYLEEKDYQKAKEFYEIGASLDYDGRQSLKPFMMVSENEYQLGLLYLKGLGVEQDVLYAKELFDRAAKDCGERSLPIIGDLYYDGTMQNGKMVIEKDRKYAINCYLSFNPYNLDRWVYYKYLNKEQKARVEKYLQSLLKKPNVDYDTMNWCYDIYKNRLNDEKKAKELANKCMEIVMNTPLSERTEEMEKQYTEHVFAELKKTLQKPMENTGAIPKELKVGDTFIFGKFNGEPLEWKVLEPNEDGSWYILSTKIIAKMPYENLARWLNNDFFEFSFTDEEKSHIKAHRDYDQFYCGITYVYPPTEEQFIQFEGTYPKGTIKETEFAKTLSNTKDVHSYYGVAILEDGQHGVDIDEALVRCVRPAMDVFMEGNQG